MSDSPQRSIEQLKAEYELLNERKIKTQTQLDEATHQLEKLQAEAVAEFETSDIEQLQAKLKQMEAENERRRREYQALIDSIATDLDKIESESNSPASDDGDDGPNEVRD